MGRVCLRGAPFSEDIVEDDPKGGGDVDGVFVAFHGDGNDGLGAAQDAFVDAVHFVSKDNRDGLRPDEVGHGHGVGRDLDGDDGDIQGFECVNAIAVTLVIGPGDIIERAEGGFFEFGVRGMGGHAAEVDMLDGPGVGGTEDGSDIKGATQIVEHDMYGVSRNDGDIRGRHTGVMGFQFGHTRQGFLWSIPAQAGG